MNEFDRAGGRCISRSLAGLLATLLVVLTVRAPESAGQEPVSFRIQQIGEAILEPLPPVVRSPETVPAPDPDKIHARIFRCTPFPSAATCGQSHLGKEPGRILAHPDDPDFVWRNFGPRMKRERIGIAANSSLGKVCVDDEF